MPTEKLNLSKWAVVATLVGSIGSCFIWAGSLEGRVSANEKTIAELRLNATRLQAIAEDLSSVKADVRWLRHEYNKSGPTP